MFKQIFNIEKSLVIMMFHPIVKLHTITFRLGMNSKLLLQFWIITTYHFKSPYENNLKE